MFKRKHCGAELPPNQVLVKLRKPGERPIWNCLDWHEFRRGFIRLTTNLFFLRDLGPRQVSEGGR